MSVHYSTASSVMSTILSSLLIWQFNKHKIVFYFFFISSKLFLYVYQPVLFPFSVTCLIMSFVHSFYGKLNSVLLICMNSICIKGIKPFCHIFLQLQYICHVLFSINSQLSFFPFTCTMRKAIPTQICYLTIFSSLSLMVSFLIFTNLSHESHMMCDID